MVGWIAASKLSQVILSTFYPFNIMDSFLSFFCHFFKVIAMLEEYKNQFTLEGHQYALRGKGNCYQELYPKNFEDAERILREKGKRFTLLPKALVKLEIDSCGNWTLWTVVNPYHYPIEDLEDYTPEWEDYVKLYEDFVSSWGNGQVLEFKGLAIKKWCDNPSYRESQVLLIES